MAMQSAVDNLKGKPKDERTAVAGGIALSVVIVLLIAWGIVFFRKIQNGTQRVDLSGGAQDQFNFNSVKDAQQKLQAEYSSETQNQNDLKEVRDAAVTQQTPTQPIVPVDQGGAGSDQFGSPQR